MLRLRYFEGLMLETLTWKNCTLRDVIEAATILISPQTVTGTVCIMFSNFKSEFAS